MTKNTCPWCEGGEKELIGDLSKELGDPIEVRPASLVSYEQYSACGMDWLRFFGRSRSDQPYGTNLLVGGMMGGSEAFIVSSLAFDVRGPACRWVPLQTIGNLFSFASLELSISDKLFDERPGPAIWALPVVYDPVLVIRPLRPFSVVLRWGNPRRLPRLHDSRELEIGAWLRGWRVRPTC